MKKKGEENLKLGSSIPRAIPISSVYRPHVRPTMLGSTEGPYRKSHQTALAWRQFTELPAANERGREAQLKGPVPVPNWPMQLSSTHSSAQQYSSTPLVPVPGPAASETLGAEHPQDGADEPQHGAQHPTRRVQMPRVPGFCPRRPQLQHVLPCSRATLHPARTLRTRLSSPLFY